MNVEAFLATLRRVTPVKYRKFVRIRVSYCPEGRMLWTVGAWLAEQEGKGWRFPSVIQDGRTMDVAMNRVIDIWVNYWDTCG